MKNQMRASTMYAFINRKPVIVKKCLSASHSFTSRETAERYSTEIISADIVKVN